jgi:hypothetical protein
MRENFTYGSIVCADKSQRDRYYSYRYGGLGCHRLESFSTVRGERLPAHCSLSLMLMLEQILFDRSGDNPLLESAGLFGILIQSLFRET